MLNEDNKKYYPFTGRQRLDKVLHTLEGILKGIAIDKKINDAEVLLLNEWIDENRPHLNRPPYNEIAPLLEELLSDGVLDEEEKQDLLWLCDKFMADNIYFSVITSDMQRLQGILGGIAADRIISKEEIRGLQQWMQENEHLQNCWPYDELKGLIVSVLKDGIIDDNEHKTLLSFFDEFFRFGNHRSMSDPQTKKTSNMLGVCAIDPKIRFKKKAYCFTGRSVILPRKKIALIIKSLGGKFSNSMNCKLDYLVVAAAGNPCWAFACYGRKVEAALECRDQGSALLLVHENDFWDAVEERKGRL